MPKSSKPKLTPEEARAVVKRRMRDWKKVNKARKRLAEREKKLRADIKACMLIIRGVSFIASAVKAMIVRANPIKTTDSGNIDFLKKKLTPAEFEELCPRAIKAKLLRERKPDLVADLAKGTSTNLTLDYIQEPAPSARSA